MTPIGTIGTTRPLSVPTQPRTLPACSRTQVYRPEGRIGRVYRVRTGRGQRRPGAAGLQYRGTGVSVSRVPHRRLPTTVATTAGLALLSAGITVWLGLLGHFGAGGAKIPRSASEHLGVVRMEPGESLQHLAGRVAPGAPTARVVDRIRELNHLDSTGSGVSQTLIAPIE